MVPTTKTNGTVIFRNSSTIDNNGNFNALHSNPLGLDFGTSKTTELTQLFTEHLSIIDPTQNNLSEINPLQKDLVILTDVANVCLGRNSTFINIIHIQAKEMLQDLLAGMLIGVKTILIL